MGAVWTVEKSRSTCGQRYSECSLAGLAQLARYLVFANRLAQPSVLAFAQKRLWSNMASTEDGTASAVGTEASMGSLSLNDGASSTGAGRSEAEREAKKAAKAAEKAAKEAEKAAKVAVARSATRAP